MELTAQDNKKISGQDNRNYVQKNSDTGKLEVWRDCPDGAKRKILIVQNDDGTPRHIDNRTLENLYEGDMRRCDGVDDFLKKRGMAQKRHKFNKRESGNPRVWLSGLKPSKWD